MADFAQKRTMEHFTESDDYAARSGYVHPEQDPIILDFIKHRCSQASKVLEVGGGSGYMLDLVASHAGISNLYNCELVAHAYRQQVNEHINLVGGDACHLPFKDGTFDFLIAKNLLHHLVGMTRGRSKKKAGDAIREFKRVVRKGGYIVLLEQYNEHEFFASALFYISLLFSFLNISIRWFGWNRKVIVSFLTPQQIKSLFAESGMRIELLRCYPLAVPRRLKYTLLMSKIGRMLLVATRDGIT
ncbi:MAG: hypothetical protein PWR26_1247 [Methanosarcinales archaeon]|nr:hypothetical protein [Methanosarcinales archaeon]